MALIGAMLFHIFIEGKARMIVLAALEGAQARLGHPRCEQLFSDFFDESGRPLAGRLGDDGRSGAEHLSSLYFVDADKRRCQSHELMVAFTEPGSRVIHVCATRFVERFAVKLRDGELLIIHELLHALGLGEDPPAPAEIDRIVRKRCG